VLWRIWVIAKVDVQSAPRRRTIRAKREQKWVIVADFESCGRRGVIERRGASRWFGGGSDRGKRAR
jgi:hypothetical protein